MALPASGNLSLLTAAGAGRNISVEMYQNSTPNKSLATVSTEANKTANHSMSEFYGFNGLATFTMTVGTLSSNPAIEYFRSVFINDSNILGRTAGVRITSTVSVYRASSAPSTFGSVGALIRLSNPTPQSVQVWLTGSTSGVQSSSFNTDVSWTSGTAQHAYFMYVRIQNPGTNLDARTSISIASFWGNCYMTSSGSPVGLSI